MRIVNLGGSDHTGREQLRGPFSTIINRFAKTHNLRLRRHIAGGPLWSLCFAHPEGGQGKIEVAVHGGDTFHVVAHWWQDHYDSFCRRSRRHTSSESRMTPDALSALLDSELINILSWKPGEWTEVDGGYETLWSWFTKSEFEQTARSLDWPQPKTAH